MFVGKYMEKNRQCVTEEITEKWYQDRWLFRVHKRFYDTQVYELTSLIKETKASLILHLKIFRLLICIFTL